MDKQNRRKNPFGLIHSQYITEKSMVLQGLETAGSNKSLFRCNKPKYVFLVDKEANKQEIAGAIEKIYENQKIKVIKVNTINAKPKFKRTRGRSSYGRKPGFKKAIVTLEPGDRIEA